MNAAGLAADEIASLAGIDRPDYRLTYVKGHYFRLRGKSPVSHLIYPVPPPALVGLGIHVTLDLDGGARLGPDVEVLLDRTQRYDVPESLAPKFPRGGLARYLTGDHDRGSLAGSGRHSLQKLMSPDGSARDFIVKEDLPGWINLIGIESPGMTSSLPMADLVAELIS